MTIANSMNIFLIGYRCTGKTTVGMSVAARIHLPFFDTDMLIEARAGKTITEIVGTNGWESFRTLEKEIIKEVSTRPDCVIATGGGAVVDRENVEIMKGNGILIWLVADEKTITDRMRVDPVSGKQRPPLVGVDPVEETARCLREREPVYRAAADFSVNTSGKDIPGIVEEIFAVVRRKRIQCG